MYIKAVDIVTNEKLSVIVHLGGFHTLVNILGALGDIMRGGLEEAFESLYSKKTVLHVMSGKTVRGHVIIHSALRNMLLQPLMPDTEPDSDTAQTVTVDKQINHLILSQTDADQLWSIVMYVTLSLFTNHCLV